MRYYVNKNAQPNGDHEVHRATCIWLPDVENRIYLGDLLRPRLLFEKHVSTSPALTAATTAALRAIRLDSRDGPPDIWAGYLFFGGTK